MVSISPLLVLCVVLAWVGVGGRKIVEWLPIATVWMWRSVTGQLLFRRRIAKPRPAGSLSLPGDAARLRQWRDPESGAVMVHDPHAATLTAIVAVTHPAFILLDPLEQQRRVTSWGRVLATACRSGRIASLQVMERTLPGSGKGLAQWWSQHGTQDGSWASTTYGELIDRAGPAGERHASTVSVCLDLKAASRAIRAAGGGNRGAAAVLRQEMSTITAALRAADLSPSDWLGPGELAVILRASYDPDVAGALERHGDLGRDLATAGPVAVSENWSSLRSDSACHCVLWISEWPRSLVYPDFLAPVLLSSDVRRTFTLHYTPLRTDQAARDIRKKKTEYLSDAAQRQRIGQIEDARQSAEYHDVLQQEADLTAGHGLLRTTGLIAISARQPDELERAVADIEQAAIQASCETRRLWGQQAQAFCAAALPAVPPGLSRAPVLVTQVHGSGGTMPISEAAADAGAEPGPAPDRERSSQRPNTSPSSAERAVTGWREDRLHSAVLVSPGGDRRRDRRTRRAAAKALPAEDRAARKAAAKATAEELAAERRATMVLPRSGERGPATLRTPGRLRLPRHQDTSATLAGAYPFLAEGGLGSDGVFVGQDLYCGGSFVYDPWVLYARGLITAPNLVLAGIVGSGKSALAKSLYTRSIPFGRRVYVPGDPKGEHTAVAEAVGGKAIALGHGMTNRLNPLDAGHRPSGLDDAQWDAQVTARRRVLVGALAETVLDRRLTPVEHTAVDVALAEAVRSTEVPVLPTVVARLLAPDQAHDAEGRLAEDGRLVGHALRRLVAGDLAGLFDGPSTVRFDPGLPMISLDLSRVAENATLISVLMTCASAWMESALLDPAGGQRWVVYDEAWRLMSHPALLRRMDAHWRLARHYGIANMLIFHKLSDLDNVGDQGSAMRALASSLLANAETRIVYRQESDQLGSTATALGLTGTEQSLLPTLGTGQGLWRIKHRPFVVQHQLHPAELALFDTSARAAGREVHLPDDQPMSGGAQ